MSDKQQTEKLDKGYQTMLERVVALIEGKDNAALIQEQVAKAVDKAVELNELTREEAERLGDYIRRDLEDAAGFMRETGEELRDWINFDMDIIEDKLRDLFSVMVDHTRAELEHLSAAAKAAEFWHTGEITGVGTLVCEGCGKSMRFQRPGHIPPCPSCHGSVFKRKRK